MTDGAKVSRCCCRLLEISVIFAVGIVSVMKIETDMRESCRAI